MISSQNLIRLNDLIENGKTDSFYHWGEWERLRQDVLAFDCYECQICKARGRYSKAQVVHHVKHLKDRPDLALSVWDGEARQLISVCKACHEEQHPERTKQWRFQASKKQLTKERWD